MEVALKSVLACYAPNIILVSRKAISMPAYYFRQEFVEMLLDNARSNGWEGPLSIEGMAAPRTRNSLG
jgi:hypothetical protein